MSIPRKACPDPIYAATLLLRHGCCILPLPKGRKGPPPAGWTEDGWRRISWTPAALERGLAYGSNWAAGILSRKTTCLDFDSRETWEEYLAHPAAYGAFLLVDTPHGGHAWHSDLPRCIGQPDRILRQGDFSLPPFVARPESIRRRGCYAVGVGSVVEGVTYTLRSLADLPPFPTHPPMEEDDPSGGGEGSRSEPDPEPAPSPSLGEEGVKVRCSLANPGDGATVRWDLMRRTPAAKVEWGIRNEWLIAHATFRYAKKARFDVLAWLRETNLSLPCPDLPDPELVKMVPGVEKWGQWLIARRRLSAVTTDHGVEAQRRRGLRSGRARQVKAMRRDERIAEAMAHGLTRKQIAERLDVSVRTVDTSAKRLREAGAMGKASAGGER